MRIAHESEQASDADTDVADNNGGAV